MKQTLRWTAICAMISVVVACGPKGVQITPGGDQSALTGAAGGSESVDSTLNRCARSVGTLAISGGQSQPWYSMFQQRTGVASVEPILRFLSQQSNCFEVVTLGNIGLQKEIDSMLTQMRGSGEYRAGSNLQTGQRKAADYLLLPTVLYAGAQDNTVSSGIGGVLGGAVLGSLGSVLGSAAGNRSSTSVTLSVFSVRENTQVVTSQGSATASQLGTFFSQMSGSGPMQAYNGTQDGKATAAAFYDAFNKLAVAIQAYKPQDVDGTGGTGGGLIVN